MFLTLVPVHKKETRWPGGLAGTETSFYPNVLQQDTEPLPAPPPLLQLTDTNLKGENIQTL